MCPFPVADEEEIIARIVRQEAILDDVDTLEKNLLVDAYYQEQAALARRERKRNGPKAEAAALTLLEAMAAEDEELAETTLGQLEELEAGDTLEWQPEVQCLGPGGCMRACARGRVRMSKGGCFV